MEIKLGFYSYDLTSLKLLCLVLSSLMFSFAYSQPSCPVDDLAEYTQKPKQLDELVHLNANNGEMTSKRITLTGNAEAFFKEHYFIATHLTLDKKSEFINSKSDFTYGQPNFALRAKSGDYDTKNEVGQFKGVEYYLRQQEAIGSAKTAKIDKKNKKETFTDATFTTCQRNNPTWQLGVSELTLDHNKGVGYAKNSTFFLGETRLLSLPYLSFALDNERKSGFLYPTFSLDQQRGLQVDFPYYFNIAPNMDDTLTTRVMSKRGVMLSNEFRYLFDFMKGSIETDYLPYDKQTGRKNDRWRVALRNNFTLRDDLYIDLLYQQVSDSTYLNELEDTLDLAPESFLESHLNIVYEPIDNVRFSAQWQRYQLTNGNLTANDKPYEVLPKIGIDANWSMGSEWKLSHSHELTRFYKANAVSGTRFHNRVKLAYEYDSASLFFKPAVSYQHVSYKLDNTNHKNNVSVAAPTLSIDAGYRLERSFLFRDNAIVQTLEPRFFYLRTPYKNQKMLPNFDTDLLDISYDYMFLDNRFTGKDRIGDANQLTTAISSRFIDKSTGVELGKLSIGQIHYFEDRKVSLNDSIKMNSIRSEIVAEGSVTLNENIKLRGLWHGTEEGEVLRGMLGAQYFKNKDELVNLYYLYDYKYYEQADISGVWRLGSNWRTFFRYNHSIRHDKTIDALAGLEYGDCCGAVRFALRQYRPQSLFDDLQTGFFLEFSLKGLGDIGFSRTSKLNQIIPGYKKSNYEH